MKQPNTDIQATILDYFLTIGTMLPMEQWDREIIEQIRKKFQELGIEAVKEELETNPDIFGVSGRRAREAVSNALQQIKNMESIFRVLHKTIDCNI